MILEHVNPANVGVNPTTVEKITDMFTKGDINANAMLMARHGKIFCELYKSPWNRDNYQMVFSVTKSIVAIAAGFAVSEGLITVNDSVISYFDNIIKEPVDENMKLMKIEHLLTMTSGHYADGKGEWVEYNDIIKNFLLNPVPNKPGEKFSYCTDGVNVLSQIIERASGVRFDKYVDERLFKPLGIVNYQWDDEVGGIVNAGYGLHLHAKDLAKIGLMLLDGGKWDGKQILDSAWVERSGSASSNGGEYGYGYLFWRQKPAKSYAAIGMDGQYCIILPEQDMVIVLIYFKGDLQSIWDIILPELDGGKATKMIDRVTELLTRQNIINGQTEIQPVNVGSGGAYVFSVDDKYIVKYAYLLELEIGVRKQLIKEYYFYKYYTGNDFIPELVYQYTSDDEMLLVMKKYTTIKPDECTEDLQKSAMELYARVNALDTKNLARIFKAEKEVEQKVQHDEQIKQEDSYPLSKSYEDWERLQKKFPEHIDGALLKEMYQNFNRIDSDSNKIKIPETLCQGDFHPENILRDGGRLLLCDWQGVGLGAGIGDISFFISRGADMGLKIDRDKLIRWYSEAFYKYTNLKVDITDFYKKIASSEFLCSFSCWAHYLQDSDIVRVMNIYNAMAGSYNILIDK